MEGHFCMPFVVDYLPGRGRFLRASRDIEPGETILIDTPFVQGPPAKSPPICLQCSKLLSTVENSYECSKCGLPVCNEACESGEIHRIECGLFTAAFQNQPPKPDEEKDERILLKPPEILGNADNPVPFYACIGPLRLLLNTR